MRVSEISRKTNETDIKLKLNIDGIGKYSVDSGCGFFDHMLELFARHARYDIELVCKGDTHVDYHHTVEDIGIVIGAALDHAMNFRRDGVMGIRRYGNMILPMDETLILSAIDYSGRAHLEYSVSIPSTKVGDFDTELCEEFWRAFVRKANITLHIKQLSGTNSHHIIEGIFKSVARSLGEALSKDERYKDEIPSTKGVL